MKKIVGIGACVADTLFTVPYFPKEDTKLRAASSKQAGGGPVATGLVAASKLGAQAAYIGVLSDDAGGKFLKSDFEKYGMSVYFTHPYTSCEKGTNECHNKMLRRFIPKGKPISSYTAEDICYFADCINGLPRKILGYRTPEELFEQELDKIYAA